MTSFLRDLRKVFALLPLRFRWAWLGLVPVGAVGALAEAASAGAVLVLLRHLSDGGGTAVGSRLGHLLAALPAGPAGAADLVAFVALLYVWKNLLLAGLEYAQARIASESAASLSRRLVERYLEAPYAFHRRRNSVALVQTITLSVEEMLHQVVGSLVHLAAEILVVAAIVLVLVLAAPQATLAIVVPLAALLALLAALTRRSAVRLGRERHAALRGILANLQQGLGGLKELRVLGREANLLDAFAENQSALARARTKSLFLAAVPRFVVETVFVIAVLGAGFVALQRHRLGVEILPLLGLYAYAGFRLIPSVNRILVNLQTMRYGMALVDDVARTAEDLARQPREPLGAPTGPDLRLEHALVLSGVCYAYEPGAAAVLDGVDLVVRRGESLGIAGSTGAGKSTLIDIVLALLEPTRGEVCVDGRDIFASPRAWRRAIGYVPQEIFLFDDTLRRNVACGVPDAEIDPGKLAVALHLAQLDELVTRLPEGVETPVGERGVRLSGGERQRVVIARALYSEPELLLFDEATAALDPRTERDLVEAIDRLHGKKTVIVVAHRLTTVRGCDRVAFLSAGRIEAIGPYESLLAESPGFRELAAARL